MFSIIITQENNNDTWHYMIESDDELPNWDGIGDFTIYGFTSFEEAANHANQTLKEAKYEKAHWKV